ncbi:SDR family oxidoreductase [Listeria monocytogenes]|nr:SDR family oxidoreductase [Listeria monocytogenes]EAC9519293.1 SDR family oxidoreductase [Listeria monocytogenes]EAE6933746.1 SDR family oxidoreductase [Listeria monocytogenes]EAF8993768.1 SDR family oxidoreductase [Listeria monocytogenes]ECC2020625.1 SDR family oxidoreductase [Listeria monocytogenes]
MATIDFKDKVVVITGAGGVICGNLAKAFGREGAKVALLDLNQDAAENFADEIIEQGGQAKGYKTNVLDKESLEEVNEAIKKDFGLCDILINGAGGNNPRATTDNEFHEKEIPEGTKTFFELDKSGIEFVFNLNYLGTLLPTQVFAKDMLEKETASIINISSMNAYTPLTKIPAYSGAKAAVSNLTEWLSVHFSKTGIRCNGIAPGFLVTKQNEKLLFDGNNQPTPRTEKILRNTPMGRFGKADELIGGVLFLASNELSSFVNGVVLPIDGGFSAYSGV